MMRGKKNTSNPKTKQKHQTKTRTKNKNTTKGQRPLSARTWQVSSCTNCINPSPFMPARQLDQPFEAVQSKKALLALYLSEGGKKSSGRAAQS